MSLVFWTTDNDNNEMLSWSVVSSVRRKSSLFMRRAEVQNIRQYRNGVVYSIIQITDYISLLSVLLDTDN